MCGSIKPGVTMNDVAFKWSAERGTLTVSGEPTSTTDLPAITIRAGEILSRGVSNVPASIARTRSLLTAGSEMRDDFPQIAAVFSQQFFGAFAIAAERAHHDADFEVAAGIVHQLLQFIVVQPENFPQDLHAALAQL